jgi:hypothetical protein
MPQRKPAPQRGQREVLGRSAVLAVMAAFGCGGHHNTVVIARFLYLYRYRARNLNRPPIRHREAAGRGDPSSKKRGHGLPHFVRNDKDRLRRFRVGVRFWNGTKRVARNDESE